MKRIPALLMFVMLAMPLAAAPAFAGYFGKDGCRKGQCPWSKQGCTKCESGKSASGCPIAEKFMKKAHFFLDNQSELGLSDEQVNKIKNLKTSMKKTMIRHQAEQQIFMLDMKSKLGDSPMDIEGMNTMIDQAMTSMATGAKGTVASLAELKSVLTEEQMTKARAIWRK